MALALHGQAQPGGALAKQRYAPLPTVTQPNPTTTTNSSKKENNMKTIKIKLTFTEPILGTSPTNEDIYRDFIGSKAPDAATIDDEVAALGVDAVAEKGMTVFPRLPDGTPFLYDYQIKGFFKDTCGGLKRVPGTLSSVAPAGISSLQARLTRSPCMVWARRGRSHLPTGS